MQNSVDWAIKYVKAVGRYFDAETPDKQKQALKAFVKGAERGDYNAPDKWLNRQCVLGYFAREVARSSAEVDNELQRMRAGRVFLCDVLNTAYWELTSSW